MKKLNIINIQQLFALILGLILSITAQAEIFTTTTIPDLVEPEGTYNTDAPTVTNMKVKTVILDGLCVPDDYEGCTLTDVINDVDTTDDFKPEIKVHMTADDFPDDGLTSNAEMRQRGATSRVAPQKSFRVKLDSKDDLWNGERRIQLIKSFYDFARVRNKLSYDLMVDIPNLPSMRTQFVNLEVENANSTESYGLYTQVEYFGKEYLVRRGWDDDSGVYKAEYFNFQDDPALELDTEGKPIDEDAFENLLEIKRGKDHTKLLEMIKAVNNLDLDFQTEVFEKYFNQENYLSWLATNILLGNMDTNFHNYYLYNPKDTDKFYLFPWDYDLIGGNKETLELRKSETRRTSQSHANWWSVKLHKRFLKQPGNLELLKNAVLELKTKYFSKDKIQDKLDSYYSVIFPRVSTSPDIDYTYLAGSNDPERIETYNRIFTNLANIVENSYQLFLERIGDPMAFWLYNPYLDSDDLLTFSWGTSESLTGAQIKYDLEIATSGKFEEESILKRVEQLNEPKYKLKWTYPSGNYFYRAIARDVAAPDKYLQMASNTLRDDGRFISFGARAFDATESVSEVFPRPKGIPDFVTTPHNEVITIDVLANDVGNELELVETNFWTYAGGNAVVENNQIKFTPKSDFSGDDKIWYVFKDSQDRSNYGVVTIEVEEPYVRAKGKPDSAIATTNEKIFIDVLSNDEGSGLKLVSTNFWSNLGGNAEIVDGKISYISKTAFEEDDAVWYVIEDSRGFKHYGKVTITVEAPSETDVIEEVE